MAATNRTISSAILTSANEHGGWRSDAASELADLDSLWSLLSTGAVPSSMDLARLRIVVATGSCTTRAAPSAFAPPRHHTEPSAILSRHQLIVGDRRQGYGRRAACAQRSSRALAIDTLRLATLR
eukprot:scaffold2114_cov309-Prasinococcus_capsulatus_cf.AAC.3